MCIYLPGRAAANWEISIAPINVGEAVERVHLAVQVWGVFKIQSFHKLDNPLVT